MRIIGGFEEEEEEEMSELVARTGRHQQRYEHGCRLVAGYRSASECDEDESKKIVEVLMINSASGPGLLFPKGGWENDETVEEAATLEALEEAGVKSDLLSILHNYEFKSKTLQDEFSPEGLCKALMFALLVKEELQYWPEQSTRQRHWLAIAEALECCRHLWMRQALEEDFMNWHSDRVDSSTVDEEDGGGITSPRSQSGLRTTI